MANPYETLDAADEVMLSGCSSSRAEAVVSTGLEEGLTCGACEQPQGFYRETVGAYMCASCGAIELEGVWE
jgi:hypothetical protein